MDGVDRGRTGWRACEGEVEEEEGENRSDEHAQATFL